MENANTASPSTDLDQQIKAQLDFFWETNDYQQVIEIVKEHIPNYPNDVYMLELYGAALLITNQLDLAYNILNKALKIDPKSRIANYYMIRWICLTRSENISITPYLENLRLADDRTLYYRANYGFDAVLAYNIYTYSYTEVISYLKRFIMDDETYLKQYTLASLYVFDNFNLYDAYRSLPPSTKQSVTLITFETQKAYNDYTANNAYSDYYRTLAIHKEFYKSSIEGRIYDMMERLNDLIRNRNLTIEQLIETVDIAQQAIDKLKTICASIDIPDRNILLTGMVEKIMVNSIGRVGSFDALENSGSPTIENFVKKYHKDLNERLFWEKVIKILVIAGLIALAVWLYFFIKENL